MTIGVPFAIARVGLRTPALVRWWRQSPKYPVGGPRSHGDQRPPGLDLGAYDVRVSAVGFLTKTVAAVPTEAAPIVDLQDIPLSRATTGGGENPPISEFPWAALILAIILTSLVTSFLNLFLFRRRDRKKDEDSTGEESSETGRDDEDTR